MTSLVDLSHVVGAISHHSTHKIRHILKPKRHRFKTKCDRDLNRKLKKYKLRQDGKEDQDILDMSSILVTSLIIKSPNNNKKSLNNLSDIEFLRPKNYLFKMMKNKQSSSILKESQNCKDSEVRNSINENSQEQKETNAFKLLMESRNKIIGGNSPGKDKVSEKTLVQEIENKNMKAKRYLVLQKMAESKGSLKLKEIEDYKDKFIKQKMEKRADKFKSMLLSSEPKTVNEDKETSSKTNNKKINTILSTSDTKCYRNKSQRQTKTFKLIDIFTQSDNSTNSEDINKEQMSQEDKEFLDKLSPSLKKKENMLCYFQKIEKEIECPFRTNDENKTIKVKLPTKCKKKDKMKKSHLNNKLHADHSEIETNSEAKLQMDRNRQKRKRNLESIPEIIDNDNINTKDMDNSDRRPKRNIKMPIKYSEQLYFSSSDDELDIFAPKKKKHGDKEIPIKISKIDILSKNSDILSKPNKKKIKQNITSTTKHVKLAPIFNTKPKSDIALNEARQKFLQSGLPNQIKKIKNRKNNLTDTVYFTNVVHVQQKDSSFIETGIISFPLCEISPDEKNNSVLFEQKVFETLLNCTDCNHYMGKKPFIRNGKDFLHLLKEIKPQFPVYRTYRMLRDKRKGEQKEYTHNDLDNSKEVINGLVDTNTENPVQLSWCDRYKATSTKQIIGNLESISELKKWLVLWKESQCKSKNKNGDSDFSDFYHSDTDSGDTMRNGNNLLILTGPVGCGKTSSVYAVAAELAIKVIEVNTSNKRTGKVMLQDLQEATQSHKVNRGASNSENSQKSIEVFSEVTIKKKKKRGRSKKINEKLEPKVLSEANGYSASQESMKTDSSLILIDDADIVFEQDDGFSSAIMQLIQSSKRPVILVVSTLTCQHLQRFLQNGKILKMHSLSPIVLGTWLDIMCIADTGICFPGAGAMFLDYFKGDIRKTINLLQFYMSTQSQSSFSEIKDSQSIDQINSDENSNMSWVNSEEFNEKTLVATNFASCPEYRYIWNNFIHQECNLLHYQYPLPKLNKWWSFHSFISETTRNEQIEQKPCTFGQMQSIANAIESFSISDFFNRSFNALDVDVTCEPWSLSEIDNVTEQEDLTLYVKHHSTTEEICHELIKNSVTEAQKMNGTVDKKDIDVAGLIVQSKRDQIVSRHNNLSSYLNPSAVLDRRAVALDYWPSCRALCKIEKTKTDIQVKRKNRFCHYLKSLNILCSNDNFESLSDSLVFHKENNSSS